MNPLTFAAIDPGIVTMVGAAIAIIPATFAAWVGLTVLREGRKTAALATENKVIAVETATKVDGHMTALTAKMDAATLQIANVQKENSDLKQLITALVTKAGAPAEPTPAETAGAHVVEKIKIDSNVHLSEITEELRLKNKELAELKKLFAAKGKAKAT